MDLFTPEVHARENNKESETALNDNRKHFSAQCRKVLDLLLRGDRLTIYDALVVHGISSLPRRAQDLIENRIDVKREFKEGTRIKEYYLTQEEINRVRQL